MTLARRFLLFLLPVVLLVGVWSAFDNWRNFNEEVDFIAHKAMQTDIQELQVLARDPLFVNYQNHLAAGFHEYAQQELKELQHIFHTLMDNAEKYDRKPSHFILFSPKWEILVLASDHEHHDHPENPGAGEIHDEPFFKDYTDPSAPYSLLDDDHHKTVVPLGRDLRRNAPKDKEEVFLYLHSDFLLPLAEYRNEAWRRMIKNLWMEFGQMVLLILALIWAGSRITRPFRRMILKIAPLAHGDLNHPIPASWKIHELDLLAKTLNRMQDELSLRERSLIQTRNQADDSRAMLRQVLDTIPVHVFWKDPECRYIDCNARFAALAGLDAPSRIVHLSDRDLIWGAHAENFQSLDRQVLTEGKTILNHLEMITFPNGEERWLEINKVPMTAQDGRVIGVLGASHDVTQRHHLEQELIQYSIRLDQHAEKLEEMVQARTRQLIHAERLATLGTFSAGMAHEINNPNAFITANVQFLQQYWHLAGPILLAHAAADPTGRVVRFHPEITKTLDGILDGSGRITKIVDGLKTYSKGGMENDRVECRLEDPIRDAENLLNHRLRKEEAVLRVSIPREITIYCDRQQIAQVFVNLFNNALDAMNDMRDLVEKRITVEGKMVERHVWIWVRDNGPGIPESVLGKIFDPFYTTKGKTKGTGLGLSIVEGIIKDHRGQISIFSHQEPERQTEVVIILPSVALYHEQGTETRKRRRQEPVP
ncbi:MAG: PAS domain-containing protein [Magnetococcales bacterium]|nr:PAS domain-containing protein [Magnetococcales bacterium]